MPGFLWCELRVTSRVQLQLLHGPALLPVVAGVQLPAVLVVLAHHHQLSSLAAQLL